ncbi:MAG: thioredoxin domain-containing protein [Gemmatimonadales bacterium]|nr:thioredoxin domain-containing protein [Gemmatimonadales bacterium]MYG49256.1 thioredoxin domain-containing protein [Gemmatimonadales bacterium]MYK00470.1 thioredoxin domain-containing protein [Candidatus Palauibacter ramosifaciens]
MKRPGIQDVGLAVCFILLAVIAFRPSGVVGGRLREWRAERQVVALYREEWRQVAADRRSVLGSGDAPHTIFEFSDYRCPCCRSSHETVNGWAASGRARVVLVHVPLSERSAQAARAAICAEKQGAFARMHDYLMTTEDWESGDVDWASVAVAADVPAGTRLIRCLDSAATTERLARDAALADHWRITATPTFVSEHARIVGEASETDLANLLGSDLFR